MKYEEKNIVIWLELSCENETSLISIYRAALPFRFVRLFELLTV